MPDSVMQILLRAGFALAGILIGWALIRVVLRIEKKALGRSRLDEALHLFILKSTNILLWVLLLLAILPAATGINPASLVAVLGAGGAAIALALKDSLSNVAGGILILINKPFCRGDAIEVSGTCGIVDSIDLMTTRLHTYDNKLVTIPNGSITTAVVVNETREEQRRVDCLFAVSYRTDIRQAKEILANVALCTDGVLAEPAPLIGVAAQGNHAVQLDLKVWCLTEDYFDVKYELEENVKLAFDEAGIEIPSEQVDVHIVR